VVGCGVTVTVDAHGKVAKITPDKENPHTAHDFCAKGRTAAETITHPRRITAPMRRVGKGPEARHAAPSEFVRECRRLLGSPQPQAPDGYPYQLSNQRSRHSMNSWLNELPSLHKKDRGNDLEVHPKDAAQIGVVDGDRVRVSSRVGSLETAVRISDAPRLGVLVMKHGWGSRIFDPKNGGAAESYGTNRNLLVAEDDLDPFSQNPALSSTFVAVERID
jgi:formate dehydrogenase